MFLFDELLSNLDAKLRAQTRIEIRKLHAELGVTSLFVTHDQVEAMTLAQRMIVMNAGVMEQVGAPEQVYAAPASTFVAGFIGSPPMNLLSGRAEGRRFHVEGAVLALPQAAPRDGALTLGIRPEHLGFSAEGLGALRVELVEMLGAERLVYGRIGEAMLVVRTESTSAPPAAGQRLPLQAEARHLHWFDADTGRRVER